MAIVVTAPKPTHRHIVSAADPPTTAALKEWSAVVDSLREGRHQLLLRKGGIIEPGGRFRVDHDRFLLFPTYEHQAEEALRPPHGRELPGKEPRPEVMISTWAEVTDVLRVTDEAALRRLEPHHIFTTGYALRRYLWGGGTKPLLAVIVRCFAVRPPVAARVRRAYDGCTSWLTLQDAVEVRESVPCVSEDLFQRRRASIIKAAE